MSLLPTKRSQWSPPRGPFLDKDCSKCSASDKSWGNDLDMTGSSWNLFGSRLDMRQRMICGKPMKKSWTGVRMYSLESGLWTHHLSKPWSGWSYWYWSWSWSFKPQNPIAGSRTHSYTQSGLAVIKIKMVHARLRCQMLQLMMPLALQMVEHSFNNGCSEQGAMEKFLRGQHPPVGRTTELNVASARLLAEDT